MLRVHFYLCAAGLWLPGQAGAQSGDTSKVKASAPTEAAACCSVVRIEPQRSMVIARETATGFTFQFTVKNRRRLTAMKIGDKVWVDFMTKAVKLTPAEAAVCCGPIETLQPPDGPDQSTTRPPQPGS